MRRVVACVLKQETATFSPVASTTADFQRLGGEQGMAALRDTDTEFGGLVAGLAGHGEVVLGSAAWALASGPLAPAALAELTGELVTEIGRLLPADGVVLVLHGAMASTADEDPEGSVLARVRELLGTAVPLVATLDLHAVCTDKMVDAADALVPFHTYPHTDWASTGRRAARALRLLWRGGGPATTARLRLPMLVRGDELLTATGLFGAAIERCRELEARSDVLAAGVLIGNPYTDVPELATSVVVTTTSRQAEATRLARPIARFLWDRRDRFHAALTPLADAVARAVATDGLCVLGDTGDATAGGAPGDSNAVLRALLEHGYRKRAIVPVVDPGAVAAAWEAGPDTQVTLHVGGWYDRRHEPLALSARVRRISDGPLTYEDGTAGYGGRTAVVEHAGISLLLTERPLWLVGRRVLEHHGLDPLTHDLVVLKSPNGFRAYYDDIAALVLNVDTPGCTTPNLQRLPYRRVRRPMFPLDDPPAPSFLEEPAAADQPAHRDRGT